MPVTKSRSFFGAMLSVAVVGALLSQAAPAGAQAARPGAPRSAPNGNGATLDRLARPGQDLPAGWRSSRDRIVTVAGDATGLHVLVADESDGYTWRMVATLGVPGTDTARWIGQACLTGDGQHAVVVYAPAGITNVPSAEDRGAVAAVVDLATGKVAQVGTGVSVAYFDPGCGSGQQAVLTQGGWGGDPGAVKTRLLMVDTSSAKVTADITEPGEVTSAVPYQGNIAAAYGPGIVSISRTGKVTTLARTAGTTFRLVPDSSGGLGFQVMDGQMVQVRRYANGRDQVISTVRSGSVDLSQVAGRVFATGPGVDKLGRLPGGWQAVRAAAMAQVSSTGALAVLAGSATTVVKGRPLATLPGGKPGLARPVQVTGWVAATGKEVSFTVPAAELKLSGGLPRPLPGFPVMRSATAGAAAIHAPAANEGGNAAAASARLVGSQRAMPVLSPPPNSNPQTTTYDPDRSCSVPRNDPKIETYQPSDNQIEWAVDQAVRGDLTATRGPDLYGSGLPAYTPQGSNGLFSLPKLDGGGNVPPQVMLGILTQESDLYQASDHVIIGQAGNFEPSYSWYGDLGDYYYVDWGASDCGYGIAQVTSGMCLAGYSGCSNAFPYNSQVAVAVDYQANIAAGLKILSNFWNQLYSLGITANGGQSKYIENWYFAAWAYNSGLEPNAANGNTTGCSPGPTCHDSNGDWGLGWANNPANDAYPPDRPSFPNPSVAPAPGGTIYSTSWDMSHPQYWPYQEKVMGWAFDAFSNWSFVQQAYVQAYAYGSWPVSNVSPADPPFAAFCSESGTANDHCNPADVTGLTVEPADPCQLTGSIADHCWWHWPATWTTCASSCGTGVFTYAAGAGDPGSPGVPPGYPPSCTSSPLPKSAIIVGDTASSIPSPLGCGESWKNNGGTMTFNFGAAVGKGVTTYPSKIDFHQIAAGYQGHFWFTHTMAPAPSSSCTVPANPELEVTGTWTPPSTLTGWTQIWAAVPNVGADTSQANYQISLQSGGTPYIETVNQDQETNDWIPLGDWKLSAGASVSLNNVTCDGNGSEDLAWDALAFVPSKPLSTDYVAMGDSYSSGEGLKPYNAGTDTGTNKCHRSSQAYPNMVTLPGQTTPIAEQAADQTSGVTFSFIACSGAETPGITNAAIDNSSDPAFTYDMAGNTDWGSVQSPLPEGQQAPSEGSKLSASTTLVTLTIGGNDSRFADVIFGCILTMTDCISNGYQLKRNSNGALDPQDLNKFEPLVIQTLLPPHLEATYSAIHKQAPNAEIVVVGYPPLFAQNPTTSCNVGTNAGKLLPSMNVGDQIWMNSMGADLNGAISTSVAEVKATGVDIKFIDPTSAFTGHAMCSAAPWFLPISALNISGSFHPNAAGQQQYATLVNNCLAGKLTC